ncbi:MAG: IMP dehydrogenase [Cellulomonas sp. 73-145]|uniref:zinc-dependent alcohol dehydrogenase family protein n=1 Tax=Cellulomonas sp. 73-145 TaxID=1895739 RepID=UPI00092B37D9|nr:zinc-dependent alcohol dehydrogenase family protein [Cellulomonas sp. 73-145]OJV58963.1 MAG: IMP dehydrogenase [Cellulomonas sp. 73-145]
MRGAIIHGAGDVRFEERPDPTIVEPTDAVVRTVAACVCGSDLWRFRGLAPVPQPKPIGHEYVGVVEEVGSAVTTVKPGDFVVGGFLHSDNTCAVCRKGMHSNCLHGGGYDGCQAERIRIRNADGTLLATPGQPDADLIPSLLALSDVMGTGWHAAVCADVKPGSSVAVVGDGAVGLCGVLAAAQLGATTIIAMSRHADRQQLAKEFGATHVVAERGDEGAARVRELTDGIGADAVLECVGTADARLQAVAVARPGAMIGVVGLPHGDVPTDQLFWQNKGFRGGPAPVRAYLPHLLDLVLSRSIDPGKVFDLTLPLADVAEAYKAMDERRAIKVLLQP